MNISFQTLVLLPAGFGLLGFIEPCTIGGHLLFLETQSRRSRLEKISAVLIFVSARSLVTGLIGALVAFVGTKLVDAQTIIWVVFGVLYIAVGLAFLVGKAGFLKWRIDVAPSAWKRGENPLVLGLAFGLNIPACAAPILFGLLGLAATAGTATAGFAMMFLFGVFLSSPLIIFAAVPRLAEWLDRLKQRMKRKRWPIGVVFLLLGVWSIWFGLFVDPANWSGN